MKRVLVTGNKGFIATHLINKLRLLDPEIIIDGFETHDDFEVYKNFSYDVIFHLASIARTHECTTDPFGQSHRSNVDLTRYILRDFHYGKIVYTSSCAIYGNQVNFPIIEEINFPNPPSVYAAQKLYSENLVHFFCQNEKIPSVCLRLFNTYGEKQSQLGAYPNVLASLIRDYKTLGYVQVTGDGKQTRDFVYVSDVVNAIISVALKENVDENLIFNVCTGKEYTINYLASLITDKIKYVESRKFDILLQVGNFNRLNQYCDWTPTISLEEGVRKVLIDEGIL